MHEYDIPTLPENLSRLDRAIRIALGVVLFAVGASGLFAEPAAFAIRMAALIPIAIGGFGWSPFYRALGINTLRR